MTQRFTYGSKSKREEKYTVSCSYVHDTEAAWLLLIDDVKHWLPKSKVDYDKDGNPNQVSIPQWLIEENDISV